MRDFMAGECASVAAAVIGNWSAIVLPHHIDVKIYQPFARDTRRNRAHPVRRVADRTGEPILRYVIAMLQEAGVAYHVAQVMALRAHAVRSVQAEVWIRKCIGDQASRRRGLAELVIVLEDVRVHRTVRAVRPRSAEFAIVVAVVTIGAENLQSHEPRRGAVLIQHVGQ